VQNREDICPIPKFEARVGTSAAVAGAGLSGIEGNLISMKKHICFAGLPRAEAEALGPALQQTSAAGECVFAPDGDFVFEMLKSVPFEAVVVDLRTLGTEAASLLAHLCERYPRALRCALGDFKDRELLANLIGSPYQFLARPWTMAELLSTIERGLSLDAWLSSDKLRAFLPRLGRLPGLPSTYFEVVKRAESPDASVEAVADVIAHDPALTARLLQTVNSAVSGVAERVTTPAGAVSVLGLETVKALVLCFQIFSQAPEGQTWSISLEALWQYSFSVGQLSRRIALARNGGSRMAAEAFTAGLLHRVGQIILATNLAQEYDAVIAAARAQRRTLHDQESALLGVTSEQVGAYLLAVWGMPLPMVEAAALRLNPCLGGTREFNVLTAVHVAAVLAQTEQHLVPGIPEPKLDRAYLEALQLPWKPEAWQKILASGQSEVEKPVTIAEESPSQPEASRTYPAEHQFTSGLKKCAVVFGIFVVAAILLVVWQREREPHPTQPEPPPPVPTEKVLGGSEQLKVEAIFVRAGRSLAILNGKTVAPGDMAGQARVVSIERSKVIVEVGGEQRTLEMRGSR
jgi:HD-like signal output (HDOD) protein